MPQKILILDFGSQYTQLIARRVRELNVYCEIHPFNKIPVLTSDIKGVILSGSPCSVRDPGSPQVNFSLFDNVPLLGVCYGAQLMAHMMGGQVLPSRPGAAALRALESSSPLCISAFDLSARRWDTAWASQAIFA